jgi:hypothetical protein
MVLGKKHDPTQEQAFKDILNLGKRTALIGHRFQNGFSYWLTGYFSVPEPDNVRIQLVHPNLESRSIPIRADPYGSQEIRNFIFCINPNIFLKFFGKVLDPCINLRNLFWIQNAGRFTN